MHELHELLKRYIEATRLLEETTTLFGKTRTKNPKNDDDAERLANGAMWIAEENIRIARVDLLAAIRASHLPHIELSMPSDLWNYSDEDQVRLAQERAQGEADRHGRRMRMVLGEGREVVASPKSPGTHPADR